ncbi:hypothetical protein C8Q74DRAFT_1278092 [Fomes fomentarius]|nr:hypothetical protein C8Q74DRAFT_1278092 [Fomes fomentarius]
MVAGNLHALTVVVDDVHVHYNVSEEALQPVPPADDLAGLQDFLGQARTKAWNDTLTVITASSINFWYNFTGYSRVAVYGSIYAWVDSPTTAWAKYTIDGEYTAGNITASPKVITDYPLFVSGPLRPDVFYTLNVDVSASPDAPYVLDYVMGYQQAAATPLAQVTTLGSTGGSSPELAVGSLVGIVVGGIGFLAIAVSALLYFLRRRRRRRKAFWIEISDQAEPFSAHYPTLPDLPTISSNADDIVTGTAPPRMSIPTPIGPKSSRNPSGSCTTSLAHASIGGTKRPISSPSLNHSRSSSQLRLLESAAEMGATDTSEPARTPRPFSELSFWKSDEPLLNPYELFPDTSGIRQPSDSASNPGTLMPSQSSAVGTSSSQSTSGPTGGSSQVEGSITAKLEQGPNVYPKEKQEHRMEPSKEQLHAVNADPGGSIAGNPWHNPPSPLDSPPAYGT